MDIFGIIGTVLGRYNSLEPPSGCSRIQIHAWPSYMAKNCRVLNSRVLCCGHLYSYLLHTMKTSTPLVLFSQHIAVYHNGNVNGWCGFNFRRGLIGVLSGPSALHVWVMVSGCLTWKLSYGLVVDAGNLAAPRATETCNSRVLRDSGVQDFLHQQYSCTFSMPGSGCRRFCCRFSI